MKLEGQVAIVTGGTRGLGQAIAEAFVEEGAKVVCASRSAPQFSGGPGPLLSGRVDVAERGSVRALVDDVTAALGRVDIMVANAAVSHDGKLDELSEEAWAATVDVNLTGVFRSITAVVPQMRRQGGGTIITVSSSMARRPAVGTGAYGVTKAAVDALTERFGVELGRDGIRVNGIAPGVLDEGMGARLAEHEHVWASYAKRFAMRRPGKAAEVAQCAVFLASKDSSYVNGTVFEVTGGLSWG
ncbi:SDR family NAD(P)-dependent oxidoreductase [Actinophytocola sp.]|uniref:SDR family NAD(P)-dependent oxidoreductase n=1 Tax=Actinophytocola sp. TaxID=1872138 RepID=UPI002ED3D18D